MKKKQKRESSPFKRNIHKSTINMDTILFERIKRRNMITGETATDILLNAARRDMDDWEKKQRENVPDVQTLYDNKIAIKLIDLMTNLVPKNTSAGVLVSTCDKMGVHPNNLVRAHITTEFIKELIARMRQIYDGEANKIDKLTNDVRKLKYLTGKVD